VNAVVGEDSGLEWQQGISGGADSCGMESDVEGRDKGLWNGIDYEFSNG